MNIDDTTKTMLEPFLIALKLEREGKAFFQKAAAEVTSRLAKQTFEFLAAEEDKHIAHIERFYNSLKISQFEDLPDTADSDADERLAAFNHRLAKIRDEYSPTASDVEAYRLALDFENGAEEFYAEKMAEASNPRVRKLYRWLIDEETMHARLLKSCLDFAEDPAAWFNRHRR